MQFSTDSLTSQICFILNHSLCSCQVLGKVMACICWGVTLRCYYLHREVWFLTKQLVHILLGYFPKHNWLNFTYDHPQSMQLSDFQVKFRTDCQDNCKCTNNRKYAAAVKGALFNFIFIFLAFDFVGSAWSFVFFIPTTTANDLRLRRIFYSRFYPLHFISYLNSSERASI